MTDASLKPNAASKVPLRPGRPPAIRQEQAVQTPPLKIASDLELANELPVTADVPAHSSASESSTKETTEVDRDVAFAIEERRKAEALGNRKEKLEKRLNSAKEKMKNARERARAINKKHERQTRVKDISEKMTVAKVLMLMLADPAYSEIRSAVDVFLASDMRREVQNLKSIYGEKISVGVILERF